MRLLRTSKIRSRAQEGRKSECRNNKDGEAAHKEARKFGG